MAEKFWMPPSREELGFQNILDDENVTPLTWATKSYIPKKAFNCDSNYLNPLKFRYQILIDTVINDLVKKEFPEESASQHYARINLILNEMGFSKNIAVIRVLGSILMKIMLKTLSAGYMNEVRFLQLKGSMGRNPVIFVPTHRSYGDFILMTAACFQYNIETPVVVTGMDFYEMYGMATVLRQCGAMFMRRSFRDDKLYGAIFKKYAETVIAKGSSPFEFFIEGMRSRSGKSLAPKLGILKIIVGIYKSNLVEDITFVPVTISYDRLLEDSLFAREVIGIPKPKESTTTLLKAMTFLENFYGSVYMNLGNTISLKNFERQRGTADDFLLDLANKIVRSQQESVIITISNFVCMAILCGLLRRSENSTSVTFLRDIMPPLRKALTIFGAISTSCGSVDADIKRTVKLHTFLKMNSTEGESRIFISPYEHRGVTKRNILENAKTYIMIQHYANPCYHFLVSPAIIVSILCSENSVNKNDLFERYKLCRKLFKYEFLFFQPYESEDYGKALAVLCELILIKSANDELSACLTESNIFWLLLLLPFLRSYSFIYRSLLQVSADQYIDGLKLKSRIQKSLELEMDITDDISLYYSFSSNLLLCALQSLNDLDVINFKSLSDRIQIIDISLLKKLVHFLSKFELRLPHGQIMDSSLCSTSCKL